MRERPPALLRLPIGIYFSGQLNVNLNIRNTVQIIENMINNPLGLHSAKGTGSEPYLKIED
jgi:hypothetical protein